MVIIGVLFFIFGFVTWLSSVLIPYLQIACELNNAESYLVAFSFYISYVIMAIPSAWILKKTSYKKGMSIGLGLMALGALLFIPAALMRTYYMFLIGLFVQGSGLAILQTAANPYITILGPSESAAKRMSIMGISNAVAGVIAPLVLGAIVLNDSEEVKNRLASLVTSQKIMELDLLAKRVIVPYLVMAAILAILAVFIYYSRLPEIDAEKENETEVTGDTFKKSIWQFPHAVIGVFALLLYVGVEVIAGNTVINYASSQGVSLENAKFFTSCTLGGMLVGYIVGIITIPKYISQHKALTICAVSGLIFSICAIFTNGYLSVVFITLLGLSNSLIWPSIWPLALEGLGRFTKIGSSLLIMAIGGGALLPLLYGFLADHSSERTAYWMLIPCYGFIFYYAVSGHLVKYWQRAGIKKTLINQ